MRRLMLALPLVCLLIGAMPAFAEEQDDLDMSPAKAGSGTAAIVKKDPMKDFETWSTKISSWMTETVKKLSENKVNGKQKEKLITEVAKKLENLQKRLEKISTQIQNLQKQQPVVTDIQGKMKDLQGKVQAYQPVEKPAPAKDEKKEAPVKP